MNRMITPTQMKEWVSKTWKKCQAEAWEAAPVAWMHTNAAGHVYFRKKPQDKVFNPQPLYAAPVNLNDPAVQKRLAAQWGYVKAAAVQAREAGA